MSLTVVLADDAALVRAGVAHVLRENEFGVAGEASDATELMALVELYQPDLAVVDIRMPPTYTTEGIDAALAIRRTFPGTGVLLLSQYVDSGLAMQLLEGDVGAIGYLLKERVVDVEDFLDALRRLAAGETVMDPGLVQDLIGRAHRGRRPEDELTERERSVLTLMAEGRSNRAIAATLFLTERTVEAYSRAIFQKLDLAAEPDTNRRVLAVLAHLRSSGNGRNSDR